MYFQEWKFHKMILEVDVEILLTWTDFVLGLKERPPQSFNRWKGRAQPFNAWELETFLKSESSDMVNTGFVIRNINKGDYNPEKEEFIPIGKQWIK